MARLGRVGRRVALLAGLLLAGALLVGLGALLVRQGLDRADHFASVFGMFIGLAGLAVAGYSAWLARAAMLAARTSTAPAAGGPGAQGGPWVSGSVIGRDNIQIGSAGGDIRIDRD
jgi:hypothetical protein